MVVYTPDEVERVLGVTYTPEQRAALQGIPFSGNVLKACDGMHMLFPGFPLSLLEIRARHADLFYAKADCWYAEEKQTFSRAPVPVRWHLLRMEPVPGSLGRSWKDQQKLLLSDEVVPTAAIVAFATMLHFGGTKERLFERCYVRTSDVASDGNRVDVGGFDADGFLVYYYWVGGRNGTLGLSSVRKF